MRQLFTQFFLRSVIFPYNSLYTQAVAYTTYFKLGKPVDCFVLTWHSAGEVHVTCMCGGQGCGQFTSGRCDCLCVNLGHLGFCEYGQILRASGTQEDPERAKVSLLVHVQASLETIWLPGTFLRLISERCCKKVSTRFSPGFVRSLYPGLASNSKPSGEEVPPSRLARVHGLANGLSAGGLLGSSCQKLGKGGCLALTPLPETWDLSAK